MGFQPAPKRFTTDIVHPREEVSMPQGNGVALSALVEGALEIGNIEGQQRTVHQHLVALDPDRIAENSLELEQCLSE